MQSKLMDSVVSRVKPLLLFMFFLMLVVVDLVTGEKRTPSLICGYIYTLVSWTLNVNNCE